MNLPIRAVSFDLDDTLWPFPPIGERIERALHDWFVVHSPATAERFPPAQMRTLREAVMAEFPQHAHDLALLRRLTIERALQASGGDVALVDAAYALFYRERNRVEFYDDAREGLERIAARLPVAAVSNGNADLDAIGIAPLFLFQLGAREHGAAKPEPGIFHAACSQLGVPPGEVLHVGDHPLLDVHGAREAGLQACWLDRGDHSWPEALARPALHVRTLTELADWLDDHLDSHEDAA